MLIYVVATGLMAGFFQDNDKDGSRDAGQIKISSGTIGNDYQLSWSVYGSNDHIRFTARGMTLSQNDTFKLCPSDGDAQFSRAVVISKTARVLLPKDYDGDGI